MFFAQGLFAPSPCDAVKSNRLALLNELPILPSPCCIRMHAPTPPCRLLRLSHRINDMPVVAPVVSTNLDSPAYATSFRILYILLPSSAFTLQSVFILWINTYLNPPT